MAKLLIISDQHIMRQIKLSCQINQITETIATYRIINDGAAQAGIQLDKEELQQTVNSIRLAKKLLKADDTWIWLKKHYLSLDDLKEVAQMQLLGKKLANYLFANEVEPLLLLFGILT